MTFVFFIFFFLFENNINSFNSQINLNNSFNINPVNLNSSEQKGQQNNLKKDDWIVHKEESGDDYNFFTRFNWFQRNKVRQNAYFIYNSILSISDLFKNIIITFNKKIDDIVIIYNKFDQNITNKLAIFNLNINNLSSLNIIINKLRESIKYFEEKKIYQINKEFKKEIAKINHDIDNLVVLGKQNVGNYNLINESKNKLSDSIKILSEEINKINEFEKLAWDNYKKLDEIISDNEASLLLEEIKNYFDNTETISLYIKNDYREFFNRTANNINIGIENVLLNIDNFINDFNRINSEIEKLKNNERLEEEALLKNKQIEEEKIKNEKIKKENEIKIKALNSRTKFQKFKEFASEKIKLFNKIISNLFFKITNYIFSKFSKSKSISQNNLKVNNNNNSMNNVNNNLNNINNNSINNVNPQSNNNNINNNLNTNVVLNNELPLNTPNEFNSNNIILPKHYNNQNINSNINNNISLNNEDLILTNTSDNGIVPNLKIKTHSEAHEAPPVNNSENNNEENNNDVKITEIIEHTDSNQTQNDDKKYSEDDLVDNYKQEITNYEVQKTENDDTPLIDTKDKFFDYANATQSGGISKSLKSSKQIDVSAQQKSSLPKIYRQN